MVGCELVFLVGRGEGKEGYQWRHIGIEPCGRGQGIGVPPPPECYSGRLGDVSWRKSLRYSALTEADSRRVTLLKTGFSLHAAAR